MQSIQVSVGPIDAANDDAICESQTPNAGPLTLDGSEVVGGVAVLDVQRRVLITCDGDESANTFTITGFDARGSAVLQTVTGVNAGTVATTVSFLTVTSVTIANNADDAVKVGTNGVADSNWVRFDDFAPNYISVNVVVSGTVNYTVQTTLDDPNSAQWPVAYGDTQWQDALDANLVSESTNKSGGIQYAPVFARLVLNSGSGSARATFLQSSNGPI